MKSLALVKRVIDSNAEARVKADSCSRSMGVRSSSRFNRVISDAWSAGDGGGGAIDVVALGDPVPPRTRACQFRNIEGEIPNSVGT